MSRNGPALLSPQDSVRVFIRAGILYIRHMHSTAGLVSAPLQKGCAHPSAESLRALTGLRFAAALGVLIYHANQLLTFYPGNRLLFGEPAVSFFFVLSGFILTYVYAGRLRWSGLGKFYLTRFARIWPLHLLTLLATVFFFGQSIHQLADACKFALHFLLLHGWCASTNWIFAFNGVSWSISTEAGFYLLFPFLLLLGRRNLALLFPLWVVATFYALSVVDSLPHRTAPAITANDWTSFVQANPMFRLLEFTAGMLAAHLFKATSGSRLFTAAPTATICELVSLALFAAAWWLVNSTRILSGPFFAYSPGEITMAWMYRTYAIVPSLVVIFVFAQSRGAVAWLFSRSWMVLLGDSSYALYMIHRLVLLKLIAANALFPLAPWFILLVAMVLSVSLSVVLYRLYEMPLKNWLLSRGRNRSGPVRSSWRWSGIRAALANGPLQLALAAAAVGWMMFSVGQAYRRAQDPVEVLAAMPATLPYLRNIRFEDEALLRGVVVRHDPAGMRLKFIWENLPGRSQRRRFIHLVDAQERIVSHGPGAPHQPDVTSPSRCWVDDVLIQRHMLSNVHKIAIGFWSPGEKAAKVERGPRSMSNNRLDVAEVPALYR